MPRRLTSKRKATKHDARRSNLSTALELVARESATSRAQIARQTGLTRATVSSLVGELLDDGLLRVLGQGRPTNGGKPPTLLGLNERGRDVVAVDLSSRPFRGAIVDLAGRIHHRSTVPSAGVSGERAVEAALTLVEGLLERAQAPVLGIGAGSPGIVDPDGCVLEAVNLDWRRVELGSRMRAAFGLPVSIAKAAHVAALAESKRHPGEGVLVVLVGRGIGAGMMIDGQLRRGDHFAAGEIGHTQVVPDGRLCRCGNRGCLETVASIPSILRDLGVDSETDAWDAGALERSVEHAVLRQALHEAGTYLGAVVSTAVALLDVSHLVISSDLEGADEDVIAGVRASLATRVLPRSVGAVSVESSVLGGDLVMVGAASAVITEHLGVLLP